MRDVIEWDVVTWSKALEFWQARWPKTTSRLRCLEVGGRRGGLSLWLALKGCEVTCSDLNDPRSSASPLHRRYGVEALVRYETIDATQIRYENDFDIVVFKSMLGALGDAGLQRRSLDSIYRALKPGGLLLFAENLTGSLAHRAFRSLFVRWGRRWRYLTVQEVSDFLSSFANVEFETAGFLAAFGRSERQRDAIGRIDDAFLTHLVPRDWNYIVYGVATKR